METRYVGTPDVKAAPWRAAQRFAAWLTISFVLYTSLLMAVPFPRWDAEVRSLLGPAQPMLENLGLRHRLRLFAPEPPRRSRELVFRVTTTDGRSENWTFPRSVLAPGDPSGSYNRYLYIYVFWALQSRDPAVLTDLARYVAIESASVDNMPATVDFVERSVAIPAPEHGTGAALPEPREEVVLLRYDVANHQTTVLNRPKLL